MKTQQTNRWSWCYTAHYLVLTALLLAAPQSGMAVGPESVKTTSKAKPPATVLSPTDVKHEVETIITIRNGVSTTNFTTNVYQRVVPLVDPPLSVGNNIVHINTGVSLLDPYTVATNGAGETILQDGDSRARFYIDINANYVWAWNLHRRAHWIRNLIEDRSHCDTQARYRDGGNWFGGGALWPDFQGAITFIATDENEVSTTAIIGSGEFGMNLSLGIPIYQAIFMEDGRIPEVATPQQLYDKTLSTHWIGGVFSWSGVSDAKAFDIHSRYFVGVGYRAAFKVPWEPDSDSSPREVTVSFQCGPSVVDSVKFISPDTSRAIEVVQPLDPNYSSLFSFAYEAEVYVPLSKSINIVAGARFYTAMKDSPNTWNAYVGATVPLSKLTSIFK